MRRRDLLLATAALPLFTTAGKLYAAPAMDSRVLVVFLRGAYDAANIVVPISSDFYYEARPSLKIARPDAANPKSAIALDADWGLHPALKDTLYPLWTKKQLAFVPFAGSDDVSRSHFETQDTIELGQPLKSRRDYNSGFMARLSKTLNGDRPIAFTNELPLTFRGGNSVPNVSLNYTAKPSISPQDARLIQAMYAGQSLAPAVSEGFEVQAEIYQAISAEMQAANRGAVSPKGFELAAERIGILMREKFNLGFVDVGGWDTHVNQGGADGYLSQRIAELGRGVAAFAAQLGSKWDNTVVVVVSEFGRTFRENGDRGTDHGHGSVYWVLGGGIRGGLIAGEQVAVTRETLFQDRDFVVLTDYRALLGGLFKRIYGLSPEALSGVFAAVPPADLALI